MLVASVSVTMAADPKQHFSVFALALLAEVPAATIITPLVLAERGLAGRSHVISVSSLVSVVDTPVKSSCSRPMGWTVLALDPALTVAAPRKAKVEVMLVAPVMLLAESNLMPPSFAA